MRYLDTDLPGLDQVKNSINFVLIEDVSAIAQFVMDGIENVFKSIEIKNFGKKIIV